MDLGYNVDSYNMGDDEDVIGRDIVDEETGFVIPIRLNKKTETFFPFDNKQLLRWRNWNLL